MSGPKSITISTTDSPIELMKRSPLAGGPLTSVPDDDLPAIAGGTPVRAGSKRLVFGAPIIGEAEIESVVDCLRSRWIGLGPRVEQFERAFARYKDAPYAAAVSSGTAAIHLALLGFEIGPGDEVIAPAMTFCSTIHSIIHCGATPVLVDCDRSTFNIDPSLIEKHITERTKAIVAVHMCGRCCDMDAILDIARRHQLRVVEDCAHAIESKDRGRAAGLMGDAGCFSFYPTKNVATCDGGMVITRDRALYDRVKVLSLHGMTADAWSRFIGGPSGYDVVAAGFKYNMTDIAAALALPQLENVEERWQQREHLWRAYNERLAGMPLDLPAPVRNHSRHAFHLYTPLLRLENIRASREQIIAALAAENIGVGVHYVPVHRQPYFRERFGFTDSDMPNAGFIGERTISLPLSSDMSFNDVDDVVTALARIFRYYKAAA
jgi:dTDP-4-amino-4,6-dideoxygalactose transaminase